MQKVLYKDLLKCFKLLMQQWIIEELNESDFGDERLNERYKVLTEQLSNRPERSIPGACKGWAETQAAYRFFSNPKVDSQKVLQPHREATLRRIREQEVVLCVEDTTFMNHGGQKQTAGMGHCNGEEDYGYFLHPTFVLSTEGVPLGNVSLHTWKRPAESLGKKHTRKQRSIENKESYRWVEGIRRVQHIQDEVGSTRCVFVGDREADVFDVFDRARESSVDWLIRLYHDRKCSHTGKIIETVQKTKALGKVRINIGPKAGQKARQALMSVRSCEVQIRAPKTSAKTHPATATVILAEEVRAPKNQPRLRWLLLTSIKITNLSEAIEKIHWYALRWQIEIFFRVLKSGCKVEKLQLEKADRINAAVALYAIVAWRVMYLIAQGRRCPQIPCDCFFEKEEWQAIYIVVHQQAPPSDPPALGDMIETIASLGGYLARKNDLHPGPKTLWIGLQRLKDFVITINAVQNLKTASIRTCV